MNKELLTFFAWYSGDSESDIQLEWDKWQNRPENNHILDEWADRNCDCSGNCFSDADPGL